MSNRYILDPSGNIIKVKSFNKRIKEDSLFDISSQRVTFNTQAENASPKDSSYYNEKDFDGNETYLGDFRKRGFESYGSQDLEIPFINEIDENKVVKTLEDESPNFGFIDSEGNKTSVVTEQFRQYNNAYVLSNNDNKPLPFVNEFEFHTGYTDPIFEDNNPGIESLNLLINYFTSVVVEAAVIEGLIAGYKLFSNSSTIQGSRLDTNKKFLVMGEYILDEFEVFGRYFFDVINYPIEEKSAGGTYFLKRTACYFIGLNEWLSHDRLFSWEKYLGKVEIPFFDVNLNAILEKTVDITLSNFSNSASLKRMLLLVKKFNTQKYWVTQQLYKYKSKNYTDEVANIYNYYYFKFFIERVNVGIKIYNRIYAEDAVSKEIKKGKYNTNRISQDFNNDTELTDISKIDFNNDTELSNIRDTIRDLALSGKSGQEAQDEIDSLKENLRSAANKNAKYNFTHKFKGLSIKSIPSALMFNKTSLKNTNYLAKDDKGNYIFKDVVKDFFAKTNENYLPIDLVNKIEKNLEAEYMPFYFHDLRTNELLSFHAFIENITDSYSPEYTATGGFGRIDDVRTYVKTTRSISLSFTVAAMNKSDHETMWYYLNKLVSMVYPQWSSGEELILNGYTLEQPFSQVPTNSPLIRLRLGDLIKNNYSRFNLSRIFGLDKTTYTQLEDIYTDKVEFDWSEMNIDIEIIKNSLKTYVSIDNEIPYGVSDIEFIRPYFYYVKNDLATLIPIDNMYLLAFDVSVRTGNTEFVDSFVYTKFYGTSGQSELVSINEPGQFIRVNDKMEINSLSYLKKRMRNSPASDDEYLNDMTNGFLFLNDDIKDKINFELVSQRGDEIKNSKYIIDGFMKPFNDDGSINNPITQAYESRMSKGLAGHITSLDFNYSDANWELEKGAKAPMMVKVTLNFAPIHDIPPGLDNKGMMRSVNYNVGNLNKSMFN